MINYEDLTLKQIEQSFSKKPGLKKAMKDLRLILNNNEKSKKAVGLQGITFSSDQLKDGSYSYTARVYVYNSQGKRTQKPFTSSSVTESRKLAYDYQQNHLIYKDGKYYFPEEKVVIKEITVAELIDSYIETLDVKEVSKFDYYGFKRRYVLNVGIGRTNSFPKIADLPVSKVGVEHVEQYKSSMLDAGYSPKTINEFKSFMSSVFKYAMKVDLVEKNYFSLVKGVRHEFEPPEFLLAEETEELLEIAKGSSSEIFINLLIHSGIRFAEGRGLRWRDINIENGVINIRQQISKRSGSVPTTPKTKGSIRTVELNSRLPLFAMLLGLKVQQQQEQPDHSFDENRFVFSHPDGKPLSEQSHRKALEKIQQKLSFQKDKSWSYHTLRHTFVTLMLGAGIDIGIVSRMAGHSDVTVTYKYYSHAIPGEGKEPSTKFAEMIYSDGLEK